MDCKVILACAILLLTTGTSASSLSAPGDVLPPAIRLTKPPSALPAKEARIPTAIESNEARPSVGEEKVLIPVASNMFFPRRLPPCMSRRC
ncbi:hypothetical protein C2845_PM16G21900 [Panicum miliaceum]|uniref:Secreted protein n=1 Tax=Panicum miliaceum TaxID=4540 RepID=A0A3L6PW35_PANMI|nr:hypothetical protein C2845_PM16G21900 [Panicum miliaceum]